MNKRGVSLMVSYAILVIIAVGISVIVYAYLKLYLPSERPECPQDIKLIIEQATCADDNLTLTISNRGLFNVTSAFIRLGKESRTVREQVNKGNEIFTQPISPGVPFSRIYPIPSGIVTADGTYVVEVQPAIFSKRALYPCEGSIATKTISCYSSSCTDGTTRLCSKQLGVCTGSSETCTSSAWPGCDSAVYLANNGDYEDGIESSCSDTFDNDCDGLEDNNDPDCAGGATCPVGIPFGAGQCEVVLGAGYITDDGSAIYDSVNTDWWAKYDGQIKLFFQKTATGWVYRAYIEWDLSSIPDTSIASVDNVYLRYEGTSYDGTSSTQIRKISIKPSTIPPGSVPLGQLPIVKGFYDDIGSGTTYIQSTSFPEIGTDKEIELAGNAKADLLNALGSDWFAIGIKLSNEGSVTTENSIYSQDQTSPAPQPPPSLVIRYTPA